MNDVMIDIETLSTRPDAAVISIAAVAFDRHGDQMTEFKVNVDPESAKSFGLHVDAQTMQWWSQQSQEAKAGLLDPLPLPLTQALANLTGWLASLPPDYYVWGNGATFDNVILASAYRAVGLKKPWSHKRDVCYRTMKELFPAVAQVKDGVAHDALVDARNQAIHLCRIFAYLSEQFAIAP